MFGRAAITLGIGPHCSCCCRRRRRSTALTAAVAGKPWSKHVFGDVRLKTDSGSRRRDDNIRPQIVPLLFELRLQRRLDHCILLLQGRTKGVLSQNYHALYVKGTGQQVRQIPNRVNNIIT